MTKNEDKKYKVFISYTWSSSAHKDWVRGLATDLMNVYVDVVFDQWEEKSSDDLRSHAELMVLDETIDKVIMVCNALYAEKADDWGEGVSVETEMISEAIYKKKQDKFILVVSEVNDNGDPYLPIYCKNRDFIDMRNEGGCLNGFSELLSAIYDEPFCPKSGKGRKLNSSSNKGAEINIPSFARRASDSRRNKDSNIIDTTGKFLSACVKEMGKLSIEENSSGKEVVVNRVSEFLPILNDVVKVFQNMARYFPEEKTGNQLHDFFEKILIYYDPDRNTQGSSVPYKADHFKFLTHEMFLYAIAVLIKEKKFKAAEVFLEKEYYVPSLPPLQSVLSFSDIMVPLDVKDWSINQNTLPNQGDINSRSDALIKRATIHDLPLIDIQQADLVLAIRSACPSNNVHYPNSFWVPIIAPHVESHHVFEIFARAQQMSYYNEIRGLLGIDDPQDISKAIKSLYNYMRDKGWDYSDVSSAIGIDELCIR